MGQRQTIHSRDTFSAPHYILGQYTLGRAIHSQTANTFSRSAFSRAHGWLVGRLLTIHSQRHTTSSSNTFSNEQYILRWTIHSQRTVFPRAHEWLVSHLLTIHSQRHTTSSSNTFSDEQYILRRTIHSQTIHSQRVHSR